MPLSHFSTSKFRLTSAAPQLGFTSGRMGILALMLLLTAAGCTSDAENIRATNEAAATPPVTSTPLSAEIGSTEIQDGDCITSSLPEGVDIESVVIVPCSADWQYRALGSFEVDDFDRYPGEASFQQRAFRECDRRFTYTLFPTEDSWRLGDRKVTCLQNSFGLSTTDPARLDRLITNNRLEVDECFNEASEYDDALVEVVSCSGEWQYRILNAFPVDDVSRYPGEGLFAQRAYSECDRRYTFLLFPTAESWSLGDRKVTCLQESFGLSVTDPLMLDRLANGSKLRLGECFNEAPETGYAMMEVVSCSGEWQFKVVGNLLVPRDGAFPGEQYLEEFANRECGTSSEFYFFPVAESWGLGDRTITCVQSAQ